MSLIFLIKLLFVYLPKIIVLEQVYKEQNKSHGIFLHLYSPKKKAHQF